MKRVVIIGSPGAGKTTFARQLATATGLPLVHLDKLYWDQKYHYQQDTAAWRERMRSLVDQPSWIIDGNYKSTFDIRFPAADIIIYLDYRTYLTAWRAVKRRITLRNIVRPDMPTTWKEKLEWRLIVFILQYRRVRRPEVCKLLHEQQHAQVMHITSPKQAKTFLDTLH